MLVMFYIKVTGPMDRSKTGSTRGIHEGGPWLHPITVIVLLEIKKYNKNSNQMGYSYTVNMYTQHLSFVDIFKIVWLLSAP